MNLSLIPMAKSNIWFSAPFNSQGHIGTGPQHCFLSDSNSHRDVCLANHKDTEDLHIPMMLIIHLFRTHCLEVHSYQGLKYLKGGWCYV